MIILVRQQTHIRWGWRLIGSSATAGSTYKNVSCGSLNVPPQQINEPSSPTFFDYFQQFSTPILVPPRQYIICAQFRAVTCITLFAGNPTFPAADSFLLITAYSKPPRRLYVSSFHTRTPPQRTSSLPSYVEVIFFKISLKRFKN